MEFHERESILSQLDAIETMLEGSFKQLQSIKRFVGMQNGHQAYPQGPEQPAQDKSRGFDYTTKEEDEKISKLMGFDNRKDQILNSLTEQAQKDSTDAEIRSTEHERQ